MVYILKQFDIYMVTDYFKNPEAMWVNSSFNKLYKPTLIFWGLHFLLKF